MIQHYIIKRSHLIQKYKIHATSPRAKRYFSAFDGRKLHHEWIVDGKVIPQSDHTIANDCGITRRTVIFLHGLLGSGKNLRNPAKRLTQQFPNLKALLLDLRGHGQSSNFVTNSSNDGGKHTIHNCALDIIETARQLNLTGIENSPIGVVGHSFGGRCALQYAHTLKCMENNADVIPPKYTWLLDTVPGKAHASVGGVIKALTNIELTKIKSKQDMIIMLTSQGIDKAIANWMTTNLKKTGNNQFEFMFDLEVAQGVLDDFPKQDFMKLIDCCTTTTSTFHDEEKVYLVMAGKNGAWTKDIVKGLQFYEDNHELVLVRLPKAGHWVHVDDLDGLMSAMEKSFANVRV